MKAIWIAPLALTVAACGQGGTTADQAPDRGAENVAFVQGAYDAFAAGDAAGVLGAMDENIVWNEAENFPYADGNPYESPAAVGEGVFGRIGADWDYWTLDIEDYLPSGDNRVVVLGRYNARHGVTGNEIDAQFVHVWTIENERVTAFQQYADTYQVQMAMTGDGG